MACADKGFLESVVEFAEEQRPAFKDKDPNCTFSVTQAVTELGTQADAELTQK